MPGGLCGAPLPEWADQQLTGTVLPSLGCWLLRP